MPFTAPAGIDDFKKSKTKRVALEQNWDTHMTGDVQGSAGTFPAFFNPLTPPAGVQPAPRTPTWPGFPGTAGRIYGGSLKDQAERVEDAIQWGAPDPLLNTRGPFRDAGGHAVSNFFYRPQDEYLEWAVRRRENFDIREIFFTCEGPDYWSEMARIDLDLVLELYRTLSGNPMLQASDITMPFDVGQPELGRFKKGDYNPYNRVNRSFAIHLTQANNTLGAEIQLAKDASLLWGDPLKTSDPGLVCCAQYGEANRNSDPTIGAAVNAAVRAGNFVSLADPIALYIKGWHADQITLDGAPFDRADELFEVVRGNKDARRILRIRFAPKPDMKKADGTPLRIEDLQIQGESIATGGQVASLIDVHLFPLVAPNVPKQTPRQCKGKPCFAKDHPTFIVPIALQQECPADGVDIDLPAMVGRAGSGSGRSMM